MKRWIFTFVTVVAIYCPSAALADGMDISIDQLKSEYFESVSANQRGALSIKFRENGERFMVSIGSDELRLNNYGEVVTLPIGARFRLIGKHSTLIFDALPGEIKDRGFGVKHVRDNRALSGKLVQDHAYMLIKNTNAGTLGRIGFTEPSVTVAKQWLAKP